MPRVPGGLGPNPNSLFRAPIDVGFDLQSTFLAKMSGFRDYPQISRFRTEIKVKIFIRLECNSYYHEIFRKITANSSGLIFDVLITIRLQLLYN